MFFVIHIWRAGASQPSRSFERNLYNGRRRTYTRVVRRVSTHARL